MVGQTYMVEIFTMMGDFVESTFVEPAANAVN